jgi:hypothetical protein
MNIAKALNLDKTRKLNGEFNGVAFTFEAKTNAVTPKFMQHLADAEVRPIESVNALASVITAWDIDMDGKEFPPTADNLAIVPVNFLGYLVGQITDVIGSGSNAEADTNGASATKDI